MPQVMAGLSVHCQRFQRVPATDASVKVRLVRFRFNDRKTAQAAAYLLALAGGRSSYMKLIKLLYLADREMLLRHGIPITGDRMISMKHGPVLSQVLDFITEGNDAHAPSAWFEYVSAPTHYDVTLAKPQPETDELSRFELGLLRQIHEKYAALDKWELVDLLHTVLPEWKDPGVSARPIEPEDILRAESRSEADIEEIKNAADEVWFLRSAS